MCHKYKLIGFINLFDIIPDFIYPVFKYKGEYYFQSGDNDIICRFVIVKDGLLKKLISVEKLKRIVVSRNSKQIYAYQSDRETIVYGNTAYMTEYLTKHAVFSCEYASDSILREEIESFLNEAEEEIRENVYLEKAIGDSARKCIDRSKQTDSSIRKARLIIDFILMSILPMYLLIMRVLSPNVGFAPPAAYIPTHTYTTLKPNCFGISDLTYISFSTRVSGHNERAFVFNAPSDLPWESRTVDENCIYTSLGKEIYVAGLDGEWLLIQYKMPDGSTQIGYTTDVTGTYPKLSFDDYTGTIIADCTMDKGNTYTLLKEGTQVKVLGRMDAGIYVEVQIKTKKIRGIIPGEFIQIQNPK